MKMIDSENLEKSVGGKLTGQEVSDFLGAASCVGMFFTGGFGILFAAGSCINWLV